MTVAELISDLEAEVTADGAILLAELRKQLVDFWPPATFAAALEVFGPSVHALNGRTRKNLDRRIGHALRVWREKYGPLTPDQEQYADAVLAASLRAGLAAPNANQRYAYAQAQIARAVNHERVHAGFQSRAGERVDVSEDLAALVAA